MTAPVDAPGAANWVDLVPHRAGVLVLDIIVVANHLVRLERVEGLPRIVVRDLRDGREWTVQFDEEAYSLGVSAGLRVRHHERPVHLFVADDADADLRLDLGTRRAHAAARSRRCRAGTTRPTM